MGEPVNAPVVQPEPAQQQGRLGLHMILTLCTLILVAGLIGFEVWKYYQPRWDGLAVDVQTSMNRFLRDDSDYRSRSAQVTTVTLMHADGNVFEGQATITASGTAPHDVPVHVMFDGSSMLWRTDPGALLFLTLGSS